MEKHSRPGNGDSPTVGGSGWEGLYPAWVMTPTNFVTCTCPVFPWPRVCNVDGCTTILSRHNQHPFCNSCRKADPYNLLHTRYGQSMTVTPRDHDGIAPHTCT